MECIITPQLECQPGPNPPCSNPRPNLSPDPTPRSTLSDAEWAAIVVALSLSPRQGQVIRGIFEGETYAQIGKRLNISPDTVEQHFREAKEKKPKLKGIADHKDLFHLIYEVLFQIRLDAALKQAMEKVKAPPEPQQPPPESGPPTADGPVPMPLPESRMLPVGRTEGTPQ